MRFTIASLILMGLLLITCVIPADARLFGNRRKGCNQQSSQATVLVVRTSSMSVQRVPTGPPPAPKAAPHKAGPSCNCR